MSEVSIQLLHVPGCPLVDGVRTTLRQALAKVQLHATATVTVEERVGDYPSPTLLIDGRDVTGRPHDQLRRGACRLDLPTERQVLSALERLTAAAAAVTAARSPAGREMDSSTGLECQPADRSFGGPER